MQSTSSESKHLQVLLKHKHIYDFYIKHGEMLGFTPLVQQEVLAAYRELTQQPSYRYNAGCSACVAEFLVSVYKWFENTY